MYRNRYQPSRLLIIEDSDEDFEALSRIINLFNTFALKIDRCIDGDDALDFLNRVGASGYRSILSRSDRARSQFTRHRWTRNFSHNQTE
jgi:hypothetical protein